MQPATREVQVQFVEATAASARALAGSDVDLNAVADTLPLDVVPPSLSRAKQASAQTTRDARTRDQQAHRGFADSLALIQLHHDTELHDNSVPENDLAKKIFVAMERARCEACCNRHHAGVAANMVQLWSGAVEADRADLADKLLLPVVFAYYTRQALGMQVSLNAQLEALVEHWRATVAGTNRQLWADLHKHLNSQSEFALVSRQLIDSIQTMNSELALSGAAAAGSPGPEDESADTDDESDADDDTQSADEASDDDDEEEEQKLTVILREEGDDDSDSIQSENTEASHDEIDLLNRDSPVSVDSDTGSDGTAAAAGGYRVFSAEHDEIVEAHNFCSADDLVELRTALDVHLDRHSRVVGKLSGKLQRVLMTQQQRHWKFDLEEGVLDSSRLARVVTDPTAALSFKMESDVQFKDTVVTLLVDNSKSMLGKPIAIAAACADLLSQTLERCGVSVEILGFTTTQLHGGEQYEQWRSSGSVTNPGRLNGLRHIIYKAADTPYRRARKCFGLMLHKDLLKQNIDGEALLWAYERLRHRPEGRKILMVISDGAPIDTSTMAANSDNFLIDHLHQVIASLEKKGEIELIAIGIGHDVTNYYTNAMTILDARDLGRSMLSKLTSLFARPA